MLNAMNNMTNQTKSESKNIQEEQLYYAGHPSQPKVLYNARGRKIHVIRDRWTTLCNKPVDRKADRWSNNFTEYDERKICKLCFNLYNNDQAN